MNTWKCGDCGTVFNEYTAGTYFEDPSPSDVTGLPPGQMMYLCCPNCGSDYYDDYEEEEEWLDDGELDELELF